MASSLTQSQYKNSELKKQFSEALTSSITDAGKLTQSIVKNSKSKDIIMQSAKGLVALDTSIGNLNSNLANLESTANVMKSQLDETAQWLSTISDIRMKAGRVHPSTQT